MFHPQGWVLSPLRLRVSARLGGPLLLTANPQPIRVGSGVWDCRGGETPQGAAVGSGAPDTQRGCLGVLLSPLVYTSEKFHHRNLLRPNAPGSTTLGYRKLFRSQGCKGGASVAFPACQADRLFTSDAAAPALSPSQTLALDLSPHQPPPYCPPGWG